MLKLPVATPSGRPVLAPWRRRALLLGAVALAANLAACSRVPDTLKIGVAQPLSGPLATLGKDMLQGVQLAVEQINKEGFLVEGKPVKLEVVFRDDKANADEGKKVAQELVDEGVIAVIGHLNSGVSIAAAPIYAAKGIAQLAISTKPAYTELGFPGAFRLVANDNLQARAIGVFAATQISGNKFAIVDDGTPYGKGLAEAAGKALAGKKTISLVQSFDDKTKAFGPLAAKLKADGIEVVVSTLNDFQIVALIEELTKIEYNKKITILGTDTLKTSEMIKYAANVGGLYATSSVLEASEFVGGRGFLTDYTTKFKDPPAYGGHYSFDATHVIAAAIRRAGSGSPEKISAAVRKIEPYGPVTGSMKWDDKGDPKYGTVGVYVVRAGKWESQVRSDNW